MDLAAARYPRLDQQHSDGVASDRGGREAELAGRATGPSHRLVHQEDRQLDRAARGDARHAELHPH
ncbi:unnamed protein product, partial [Prorocentrum cordatum]